MSSYYNPNSYPVNGAMPHALYSSGSYPSPASTLAASSPSFSLSPSPSPTLTHVELRFLDSWHEINRLLTINHRQDYARFPYHILFNPAFGPGDSGHGVALTNLENGEQIMLVGSEESFHKCLPRQMRYSDVSLRIEWPGYAPQDYALHVLSSRNRSATLYQVGAQVTKCFREFMKACHDRDFFDGRAGGPVGIRLGPNGASFEQIRLIELFTMDGMTFRAKFGLVPDASRSAGKLQAKAKGWDYHY
ncbi:hypothetical protein MKEN_00610400 [Mycena kentingensis (nom. inval.)]|nr:hypothetical protein MKEN_00610400 [Mycena kentingensis (nom. inval.)]